MGVSTLCIHTNAQSSRRPYIARSVSLTHESDTEDEEDKFFDDATWLSEDITANVTFNTVKPLLNFWAAFTASNEVFERMFMASYTVE